MAFKRGARRAATTLATALLALVPATAAQATPGTVVGATDTEIANVTSFNSAPGTWTDTQYSAPTAATVTGWSANFFCPGLCGQARLRVLRPSGADYAVAASSNWETVTDGVQTFTPDTPLEVAEGDLLAVELDGPAIGMLDDVNTALTFPAQGDASPLLGASATAHPGDKLAFNAALHPKTATTTTVAANPSTATIGDAVTYTADVSAQYACDCSPTASIGGTVEFKDGSTTVAGCSAVPLVDNEATCHTTATSPRGSHQIVGSYSGDSDYVSSTNSAFLRVLASSTVTASADPDPVARVSPIVYRATVSPTPYIATGAGHAEVNIGSVAFSVDGQPIADCQTVRVDQTGAASCPATSPYRSGSHTLDVSFNGSSYNAPATGTATFTVLAPGVTAPAVDFGGVTIGTSATKTVTFTNNDAQSAVIAGDALTGSAFAIVRDGCANQTLVHGATCDVTVSFRPADASTVAGAVTLTDDTGATHAGALAGHGVAPASTPTAPPKPATFAPGAKPQLSVTVTQPSGGGSTPTATVNVPLACPAGQACDVDGTIQISTDDFAKAAHTSAVKTTTVARFSKTSIAAGKVKTIKLHLSPSFIKKAQKAGVRRIHAVLTIHTTLGNGTVLTSQQHVTVLLPRAAKKKAAAKPHFTG
jgi:hypothetical protein